MKYMTCPYCQHEQEMSDNSGRVTCDVCDHTYSYTPGGCMPKIVGSVLVVLVSAIVLFFAAALVFNLVEMKFNIEESLSPVATQIARPAPTLSPAQLAVPASVILDQVAAFEYLYVGKMPTSAVVIVSQDNETLMLAGINLYKLPETTVTVEVSGWAHAGYDTKQIGIAVVDVNRVSTLVITLPSPSVLGWEMDTDNTKTADIHEPLDIWIVSVGAVREETIDALNVLAKEESLDRACQGGLLDGTNNEAQSFFSRWFRPDNDEQKYGYGDVQVILSQPGECP